MTIAGSGLEQWKNLWGRLSTKDSADVDRRQRITTQWNGLHKQYSWRSNWLANSDSESISTKRRGRTWLDVFNNTELPSLWEVLSPTGESSKVRPLTTSAPTASTIKFVLLCALWYSSSALSSNTGKAILIQFRYPVTLTLVQFGFVAAYCLLFCSPWIRYTKLRKPNRLILRSTLPMGVFQVGGHIFSSMAMSRIPVSTVHTIKALSPLFTVAAYAVLFGVSYSSKTYVSLLPLTIGVMLACSYEMSASNALGLLCAFGSALVFVSSNIFFKKIMPSESSRAPSHKLDKLNLLFYSSSMAFILMIPIWIFSDLPVFLSHSDHVSHPAHGHSSPHGVLYNFFLNGVVHFAQNIIAFVILSMTSPVTYSIASLIKRVVVICVAIVWFSQSIQAVQGFGICMTFFGLWMYNNAKSDVEKGEHKMRRVEAARDMLLPSTKAEHRMMDPNTTLSLTPSDEKPNLLEQPPPSSVSTSYAYPVHVPVVAVTSPVDHAPQYHRHNHHLKIVPPRNINPNAIPVTDSYPSPPLSTESPPSTAIPLT